MKAVFSFAILLFSIQVFSQATVDQNLNVKTFDCFDSSAKLDTAGKVYVQGRVFSTDKNVALPGIKVTLEGTNVECITNNTGYFLLDVNNFTGKNTGYVIVSAQDSFHSKKVFVGKKLRRPETVNVYLKGFKK